MIQGTEFHTAIHALSQRLGGYRANLAHRKCAMVITLYPGSRSISVAKYTKGPGGKKVDTYRVIGRASTRTGSFIDPIPFCDNVEYTFTDSKKRAVYLSQILAQPYSANEDVRLVYEFLSSPDYGDRIAEETGVPFEDIVKELSSAENKSSVIAFEVNGQLLSDKYLEETVLIRDTSNGEDVMALDRITGEYTLCTRRSLPKISVLNTVLTSCAMESANPSGIGTGDTFLMSSETMSRIVQTIERLAMDPKHSTSVGDSLFLCWGDNEMVDPFCEIVSNMIGFAKYNDSTSDVSDDDEDEDTVDEQPKRNTEAKADSGLEYDSIYEHFKSIKSGIPSNAELKGNIYVAKLAKNIPGRHTIAYCQYMPASELVKNIDQFFHDTELVSNSKFDRKYYGAYQLVLGMYPKKEAYRNTDKQALVDSIIYGKSVPLNIVRNVLARLGSCNKKRPVKHSRLALLKAAYNHTARLSNQKEITTMLDTSNTSIAYNLGRFLAIAGYVQRKVNPKVNQPVDLKFYTRLSQGSKLTFAMVNEKLMYYYGQLNTKEANRPFVQWIKGIHNSVVDAIGSDFGQVTDSFKIQFALGYHQQDQWFYTKRSDQEPETEAVVESQS